MHRNTNTETGLETVVCASMKDCTKQNTLAEEMPVIEPKKPVQAILAKAWPLLPSFVGWYTVIWGKFLNGPAIKKNKKGRKERSGVNLYWNKNRSS